MKKGLLLSLLLFTIFFTSKTYATHVVGGEMNYECLGGNQYRITLRVYRDCFNGVPALDNPASIGIFYSNGTLYQNLSVSLNGPTKLVPTSPNPCTKLPTNVCVEVGVYTTTVTLPPTPGGYTLSYQRCCRNQTIVNLTNPGNQGATYTATIPDVSLATCNSNPVITNWPPVFICVNTPLVYDHSAIDKDGDSLVYELCDPYTGATANTPRPSPPAGPPYNNVTWQAPYNSGNPMGGVALTINPSTGLLTGTPNTVGQFVVGVCVREFRNGVLISTTKRDFQFNVITCEKEVLALATGFTINCANHLVRFLNKSSGAITYFWDFGDPTTSGDTSNFKDPIYQYPDTGTYIVKMIGYATNPLCNDSITLTIRIVPCYPCGMTVNVATTDASCGTGGCTPTLPVVDAVSQQAGTYQQNTITWNHTVSGLETLLIVETFSNADEPTGVTYAGLPLTLLAKRVSGNRKIGMYSLLAPPGGTNQVVVTFVNATTAVINKYAAAISFNNVNQTTPLGAADSATGSNSCPAILNPVANPNELILDMVSSAYWYGNMVEDPGQTRLYRTIVGNYSAIGSSVKPGSSGSNTVSWNTDDSFWCSNAWAMIAVPIKPGCGATGPTKGSATVTVTSSNPPYTYYWDHDSLLTGPSTTGLSQGTYTVNVIDSKGCVETKIFNVNSNSPISLNVTKNDITACGLKDGSITVTADSGSVPYTYLWSTGDTIPALTGLSAGTYTVTVSDQDSCPKYQVITIISPNVLNINAAPVADASCAGFSDGSATVTPSGGASPYTYQWNTSPPQTTPNATGLSARYYVVIVTDATGCSNSDTIEVKENPPMVLTTAKTDLLCYQVNIGTATVTPTGGTAPYTFLWSPAGGTNNPAINLSAGTYTVTVTDSKGCTSTSTALVTEPAPVDGEIIDKSSITCAGTFTGTLEVLVSGGSPSFTYLWNPGTIPGAILNGLSPGASYTVTITDANGCIDTASYTLPTPGVMTVMMSGIEQTCKGVNNGSISAFPNGGNGPYRYLWDNGDTLASIAGLSSGSYTVTVTDAQNCTKVEIYVLNPSAKETPIADLIVPDSLCQNEKGQVVYTGTTPPGITYTWYFSGGTPASGSTSGPHTVSWTDGGIKTVTVITTVAGCSSDTAELPVYIKKCERRVPNIMTNDPGGNDKFWVKGLENWPGTKLVIYNRWGLKIYEDADYTNDWYGKNMRGANVSDGVYYYILSYTDGSTDHGFITIMRNQSNSKPMSEWTK